MSDTRVIFNNTCPICSREVALYKREAEEAGLPIEFSGLDAATLADAGLTRDEAGRKFHVIKDGQRIAGVDAFIILWRDLPRWAWLARLVDQPVIRPIARFVYDYVAAPVLFAFDKRRRKLNSAR